MTIWAWDLKNIKSFKIKKDHSDNSDNNKKGSLNFEECYTQNKVIVTQPNKLSFKNTKIRLYNQTFCYEAKSGKDKATSTKFARNYQNKA